MDMDHDKKMCLIGIAICTAIVMLAIITAIATVEIRRLAFQAGYEEVSVPGQRETAWQKAK